MSHRWREGGDLGTVRRHTSGAAGPQPSDNAGTVTCPLCSQRPARRTCPALARLICAVCCATKREVEIACPADCPYLVSGRRHPSAPAVRRQQRDLDAFTEGLRDLNEAQGRLFLDVNMFLATYQAPEFHTLLDDDAAQAAQALAATLETASKGLIFEHRPQSLPAERLLAALRPIVAGRTPERPPLAERDAAVVLRRVAELIARRRTDDPGNERTYLTLLGRLALTPRSTVEAPKDGPRLIVP